MVYGNYHEVYIEPVCDQCGTTLNSEREYTSLEIETVFPMRGHKPSNHEGHICNSCNEMGDHDVIGRAKRIEYHFIGNHPLRLLMIDIHGINGSNGRLKPIYKYGSGDAPDYLRDLGYGIAISQSGVRSANHESEKVSEVEKRYREAVKKA